ncbi:conserved hypothetical protein [Ahrensia sp. R2A130]|nr:conserved hypothetical protein [Ahrensia sp. R2A130]
MSFRLVLAMNNGHFDSVRKHAKSYFMTLAEFAVVLAVAPLIATLAYGTWRFSQET